ncbi:MAG: hypothetical protein V4787_17055 [Pseudomonadota bacterium]
MTNFNAGTPELVTAGTAGEQQPETITALRGGGWVVALQDRGTEIAQLFDASGAKIGPPLTLPGYEVPFWNPYGELLPLAGGGYAFIWSEGSWNDGSEKLWGQTVDASGQAQAPVQITAGTSLFGLRGAALSDGGYVIGLLSRQYPTSDQASYTITTQRVDATNHLDGGPVTVASDTYDRQLQGVSLDFMFGTPDGGYLVGPSISTDHLNPAEDYMHSPRHPTYSATLYKVDANGQPTGASLSAEGATSPDWGAGSPSVALLANGNVVTTTIFDEGSRDLAIRLNVTTSDGQPVATAVIENGDVGFAGNATNQARVTALAGSDFVVEFGHTQDTSPGADDPIPSGNYVQTFDASGHPLGGWVAVRGSVHALSDGGFIVSDGYTAQYHDVSGQSSGDPATLPAFGRIVATPDGGFVIYYGVAGDGQDAYVEKFSVAGAASAGAISGTNGDDHMVGTSGNDRMDGIRGNDTLDGGAGVDVAVIQASVGSVLSHSHGAGGMAVTTALGTATLVNIERVQFSDSLFALDTNPGGHVWEAAALFHAGFGVLPGMADLSHWTAQADQSGGMGELAQKMIDACAPGVSSQALVAYLYQQLTHHAPSADVVQGYVDQIGAGKAFATQGDLLAYAANLSLNTDAVAGIVGTVQQLDPQAF